MSETVHASTVAIGGRGVMLEGPSGAGKSDLALRLIDRGAVLVSDDYTVLTRFGDTLVASAPATIAGRIEVRGVGILPIANVAQVPVALLVRLGAEVDRLPEPVTRSIAGVPIPEVAIDPHQHSAPIKVELALRHLLE
jgi:serine kinase of HPr protein (carbohydrate metabolism regulator)